MFLCVCLCVCERNKLLPVRQTSNDFKLAAWRSPWHVVTTVSSLCVRACVCTQRCAAISWSINWLHLSSLLPASVFFLFVSLSLSINLIKKITVPWRAKTCARVCSHAQPTRSQSHTHTHTHKHTHTWQDVKQDGSKKVNRSILFCSIQDLSHCRLFIVCLLCVCVCVCVCMCV